MAPGRAGIQTTWAILPSFLNAPVSFSVTSLMDFSSQGKCFNKNSRENISKKQNKTNKKNSSFHLASHVDSGRACHLQPILFHPLEDRGMVGKPQKCGDSASPNHMILILFHRD